MQTLETYRGNRIAIYAIIFCCLCECSSLPVYTGSCQNFEDFKFSCLYVLLGCVGTIVSHCQITPEVVDVENGRPCYCYAIISFYYSFPHYFCDRDYSEMVR